MFINYYYYTWEFVCVLRNINYYLCPNSENILEGNIILGYYYFLLEIIHIVYYDSYSKVPPGPNMILESFCIYAPAIARVVVIVCAQEQHNLWRVCFGRVQWKWFVTGNFYDSPNHTGVVINLPNQISGPIMGPGGGISRLFCARCPETTYGQGNLLWPCNGNKPLVGNRWTNEIAGDCRGLNQPMGLSRVACDDVWKWSTFVNDVTEWSTFVIKIKMIPLCTSVISM